MTIPAAPPLDPCTVAFVLSLLPAGLYTELSGALLSSIIATRYGKLREQLKAARPDVNHDLENALTGAFWSSLLFVVADYGERTGRPMSAPEKWNAPGWIAGAWQLARKARAVGLPKRDRTHDALLDALYPALQERIRKSAAVPVGIDKAYKNFQKLLKREPERTDWLEELRLGALEQLRALAPRETRIPEEIEADLRERFHPLFRATFASAIKTRSEVERIANATLLAEIHDKVDDIDQRTKRIEEAVTPRKPRSRAQAQNVQKYRAEIAKEAGVIDLGALRIKSDQVRVPIDDLWVPATTLLSADSGRPDRQPTPARLEEAVNQHRFLAIQGEAGTGKTTFVKRIVFELVRPTPAAEGDALRLGFRGVPLWLTVKDLETFIVKNPHGGDWPTKDEDPAWLAHCLADAAAAKAAGLGSDWFDAQLCDANAILLLDGLDEASQDWRRKLATLVLEAEKLYRCRKVVTMRPETEQSERLLGDTRRFEIRPMDDAAVEHFIRLWTKSAGADAKAAEHAKRLRRNLEAKPAIRKMARNPLMLTVLSVLTSNGQELPEERASLLKEIVEWLAKSKLRDDANKVNQLIRDLGELALRMISQTKQNKYAVGCDTAAGYLAEHWNKRNPDLPAAKQFLEEAEVRTGLVADRGGKLVFWHRYFQEYLAAARLANKPGRDDLAWDLLRGRQSPEVLRLLAGCMAPREEENLDHLFLHLVRQVAKQRSLEARAYGVGVLAGMREDLVPTGYLLRDNFKQEVEPEYGALLQSITRIFDPAESARISIPDRVAAADALAVAGGDTRLRLPLRDLDKHADDYWVTIPAGSFLMGAQKSLGPNAPGYDEDAYGDEEPARMVRVPAFQIGRYPVTVFEYATFLDVMEREPDAAWRKATGWEGQTQHPSRPVVRLNWNEAREYCQWAGGDLPDEEQWEFAARGPGERPRRYPWGADAPTAEHCNWGRSGVGTPSPVGCSQQATPFGAISGSPTLRVTSGNGRAANTIRIVTRCGAVASTLTTPGACGPRIATASCPAAAVSLSGSGVPGKCPLDSFFFSLARGEASGRKFLGVDGPRPTSPPVAES